MNENLLIIVAKQPVAGRCKTRLAKTIGFAAAAGLYEGFLLDLRERLGRDLDADTDVCIAYEPASDPAYFAAFVQSAGWQTCVQVGADLGERLHHALADGLHKGYRRVVALSSDSPDLPSVFVRMAFAHLTHHDAVIGPCADGGYYLIGVRRELPRLFAEIDWSTERVLAQTRVRASECGATLSTLPDWYDMDTAEDLQRLLYPQADRWPLARGDQPAAIPETRRRAEQYGLLPEPVQSESSVPAGHTAQVTPALSEQYFRTLSTRAVYQNPWTNVREDQVLLPSGKQTPYGVVTFGECVGILPLLADGSIVLVRQYRYVHKAFYWEMPTGGVHSGEAPVAAALRELREEAGLGADHLLPLQSFHTSKSVCYETAHLFVAQSLSGAPLEPDDTEFFRVHAFAPAAVLKMVETGEIMDSMTVVAVYAALRKGLLSL